MRECSRKRPTTETTLIVSLTPATPGLRQQMPRTLRSIGTPAWEARYSASMQRWSTSEFIFMRMRACLPAACAATVRSISSSNGSRIASGATSTLRPRPGWA